MASMRPNILYKNKGLTRSRCLGILKGEVWKAEEHFGVEFAEDKNKGHQVSPGSFGRAPLPVGFSLAGWAGAATPFLLLFAGLRLHQ